MESHNTPSLPPAWLGALRIANHSTTQSCIFGNWTAECSAIKKTSSWADLAMWVQHCLRFRCYSFRALPLASAGTSAPCRVPGLSQLLCNPAGAQGIEGWCKWNLCSCSRSFPVSPTYLKQSDLEPHHQYLINNHIKWINQPFRCCNRKYEVKLGDRQLLL